MGKLLIILDGSVLIFAFTIFGIFTMTPFANKFYITNNIFFQDIRFKTIIIVLCIFYVLVFIKKLLKQIILFIEKIKTILKKQNKIKIIKKFNNENLNLFYKMLYDDNTGHFLDKNNVDFIINYHFNHKMDHIYKWMIDREIIYETNHQYNIYIDHYLWEILNNAIDKKNIVFETKCKKINNKEPLSIRIWIDCKWFGRDMIIYE